MCVSIFIRRNKKAKQMLEMDWSDKYQAYNLDDQCGRYSNMSPDTQHHPGTATMQWVLNLTLLYNGQRTGGTKKLLI